VIHITLDALVSLKFEKYRFFDVILVTIALSNNRWLSYTPTTIILFKNRPENPTMYRIGLPLWKQAARLGVPMKIRVNVLRDKEAGVFVATSDDLRGLVCEATTMDHLVVEVNQTIQELLKFHINGDAQRPVTDLRMCCA